MQSIGHFNDVAFVKSVQLTGVILKFFVHFRKEISSSLSELLLES